MLRTYSTCSFNPLENEAVVAALLLRTGAKLEEAPKLEGLPTRPGLTTWVVLDDGVELRDDGHLDKKHCFFKCLLPGAPSISIYLNILNSLSLFVFPFFRFVLMLIWCNWRSDKSTTAPFSPIDVAANKRAALGTLHSLPPIFGQHRRLLCRAAQEVHALAWVGCWKSPSHREEFCRFCLSIFSWHTARGREAFGHSTLLRWWQLDVSRCTKILLLHNSSCLCTAKAPEETPVSDFRRSMCL